MLITKRKPQLKLANDLTLFDMGGGMMAPKMFLTTVLKRLGRES